MNKYGVGVCYAHHGEILQGIFDINDSLLSKGLITLPCNIFYTKAVFYPDLKSRELKIVPQFKTKTLKTIKNLLANLKIKMGGTIILKSNIIEKIGLGSSTCDIVASVRCIVNLLGIKLSPELIAHYTVLTEKASDPLMFSNQNLLFAQRKGVVLRHFDKQIVDFKVLGFDSDESSGGVDTLELTPARYSKQNIKDFSRLLKLYISGIEERSSKLIGEVSTESAIINQEFLEINNFNKLLEICKDSGAVGLQISHSGTAVGFMYEMEDKDLNDKVKFSISKLQDININRTWSFNSNSYEINNMWNLSNEDDGNKVKNESVTLL